MVVGFELESYERSVDIEKWTRTGSRWSMWSVCFAKAEYVRELRGKVVLPVSGDDYYVH
ncbi:hypothetical protein QJS10_CPA03g00552 [Acorus calamus]|uniref:Uncharacterized protein n=1 Tax=Acorus calamus TaxID=4465 RepID=A0AAV9F8G6_ACOCL|nr:hypothetical protein QJS10_CPA03g00552 [Acorus calamus]